jgi:putative SOS response-associated peptidase YedK
MSEQCKIKFLLAQAGRTLVFEVYEMDERFRTSGKRPHFKYVASNGIAVISSSFPQINKNNDEVYLRGKNASRDEECSILTFDTIEEAKAYHSRVLEALKEWAADWEGWSVPAKTTEPNPSNVYTF